MSRIFCNFIHLSGLGFVSGNEARILGIWRAIAKNGTGQSSGVRMKIARRESQAHIDAAWQNIEKRKKDLRDQVQRGIDRAAPEFAELRKWVEDFETSSGIEVRHHAAYHGEKIGEAAKVLMGIRSNYIKMSNLPERLREAARTIEEIVGKPPSKKAKRTKL